MPELILEIAALDYVFPAPHRRCVIGPDGGTIGRDARNHLTNCGHRSPGGVGRRDYRDRACAGATRTLGDSGRTGVTPLAITR